MKMMKCKQLGGPANCEVEFEAETFDEIAEKSKRHGMEMFQKGDVDHLEAMKAMKEKMRSEEDFQAWMVEKKKQFDEL